MSDKEILKKAIDKTNNSLKMFLIIDAFWENPDLWYSLIFSHEFAKVFWGEKDIIWEESITGNLEDKTIHKQAAWRYHLQLMVLENKPIRYLEKFL